MGGLTIGIILILLGVSALVGVPFFSFIVAVVLIAFGLRLIAGRVVPDIWHSADHRTISNEESIDEVVIFNELNKSFTSGRFKGGSVVMVFSGGEIDLTQVKVIGTEITLEISSVFSGIRVVVPKAWKVRSTANVLLGMVNLRQAQAGDGPVTLTVRGEAAFGEIEVKAI
jgi:predicted membrane protein